MTEVSVCKFCGDVIHWGDPRNDPDWHRHLDPPEAWLDGDPNGAGLTWVCVAAPGKGRGDSLHLPGLSVSEAIDELLEIANS